MIRPVDLQQVVMKSPDVTRDTAAQQQAAGVQQSQFAAETKRQAQEAETVQQFDEAGAVLVRDRQQREGQPEQDAEDHQQGQDGEDGAAAPAAGAPQVRLGRHIDLQA